LLGRGLVVAAGTPVGGVELAGDMAEDKLDAWERALELVDAAVHEV
jgi:hypothetical protein